MAYLSAFINEGGGESGSDSDDDESIYSAGGGMAFRGDELTEPIDDSDDSEVTPTMGRLRRNIRELDPHAGDTGTGDSDSDDADESPTTGYTGSRRPAALNAGDTAPSDDGGSTIAGIQDFLGWNTYKQTDDFADQQARLDDIGDEEFSILAGETSWQGFTNDLRRFDTTVQTAVDFAFDKPGFSIQDYLRGGIETVSGTDDLGESAQNLASEYSERSGELTRSVVGENTRAESAVGGGVWLFDALIADPAKAGVTALTGVDIDTGTTEGTVGAVEVADVGLSLSGGKLGVTAVGRGSDAVVGGLDEGSHLLYRLRRGDLSPGSGDDIVEEGANFNVRSTELRQAGSGDPLDAFGRGPTHSDPLDPFNIGARSTPSPSPSPAGAGSGATTEAGTSVATRVGQSIDNTIRDLNLGRFGDDTTEAAARGSDDAAEAAARSGDDLADDIEYPSNWRERFAQAGDDVAESATGAGDDVVEETVEEAPGVIGRVTGSTAGRIGLGTVALGGAIAVGSQLTSPDDLPDETTTESGETLTHAKNYEPTDRHPSGGRLFSVARAGEFIGYWLVTDVRGPNLYVLDEDGNERRARITPDEFTQAVRGAPVGGGS